MTHVGENRSMSTEIINEINIGGLQSFEKYSRLNPTEIHLPDNNVVSAKYKNYKYRFIIMGLLISLSFTNETNVTFITCNGLNDSKKVLIIGKIYNTFGISNNSQIKNWSKIKKESSCVNTIFTKSNIHTALIALLLDLPQQNCTTFKIFLLHFLTKKLIWLTLQALKISSNIKF